MKLVPLFVKIVEDGISGNLMQTVSKWELDAAQPEIEKAIELCKIFNCSLDHLFREEMDKRSDAYSNLRVDEVEEA